MSRSQASNANVNTSQLLQRLTNAIVGLNTNFQELLKAAQIPGEDRYIASAKSFQVEMHSTAMVRNIYAAM